MILPYDNPDGSSRVNKFLVGIEGHRAFPVAIRPDGKEAIFRGITYRRDQLLLVGEDDEESWPSFRRVWRGPVPARWQLVDPTAAQDPPETALSPLAKLRWRVARLFR